MKDVKHYLENLSFNIKFKPKLVKPLELEILKCLVGSSRTSRLGPLPAKSVNDCVCENIKKNIKIGKPIEIISAWGAKKTNPSASQEVDLAEYFTLLQYSAIAKNVKMIYSPGLNYSIFLGDAYYEYIYGEDKRVFEYCSRMNMLSKMTNLENFNMVFLSSIHEEKPDLFLNCKNNLNLLKDYWEETGVIPEKKWTELESYKHLCDSGWKGTIPSIMRKHYFKRLNKLFPYFSEEDKILAILKFFAYGLMIAQKDIFGRKDWQKCTADFCLLRVPPPQIPKGLHGNRLRKRIIPSKYTKNTAPPWTIKGGLKYDKRKNSFKPTLITTDDRTPGETIIKIDLFDKFDLSVNVK